LKGWAIVKEDAAPTGLNFFFGFGSTNMPRRRRWGRTPCQNHFAMDVWGNWGLASQSDVMTIAQPFMAGSSVNQMEKSREGRQNDSFVPDGTMELCQPQVPAMNGWAIVMETATDGGATIPNY
jgi:hypothetical protein